jgi:NDP-sugar pyrophosphorylase family protein
MLVVKAAKIKDVSIIGSILARMYLFYILYSTVHFGIDHKGLLFAFIILFFSDVLSNIVKARIDRFECSEFIQITKNMAEKLSTTLDHSLTPFFTINMKGDIEYANVAFRKIIDDVSPSGKNLKDVLDAKEIDFEELAMIEKKEYKIKTSEGYKNALIIGNKTINGHETITGSIYILE